MCFVLCIFVCVGLRLWLDPFCLYDGMYVCVECGLSDCLVSVCSCLSRLDVVLGVVYWLCVVWLLF